MEITKNVYMLESVKRSRVFLIIGEKNILIDTGMPKKTDKLLAEIEELGVLPQSVEDILLTHHDVDHTGNVLKLQQATGIRSGLDRKMNHILWVKENVQE